MYPDFPNPIVPAFAPSQAIRTSSSFATTPVLSFVYFGLVSFRKSSICKTLTEFSSGVSTKDGFLPFFTSTIFLSFSNFITSTLLIQPILFEYRLQCFPTFRKSHSVFHIPLLHTLL